MIASANVKNDRDESRMTSGRLFQVRGPATANDLLCAFQAQYLHSTCSFVIIGYFVL